MLFESLVNTGVAKDRIALRLVPLHACMTDGARRQFAKKYRMGVVVMLTASAPTATADKERVQYDVTAETGKEIDQALWESARTPLAGVFAARPEGMGRAELLRSWAERLFDVLLFLLATQAIGRSDNEEAARFLEVLDSRLESLGRDQAHDPRLALRRMACHMTMQSLFRPSSDTPTGHSRDEWLSGLSKVVDRYGLQFPAIKMTYARALFLCNDRHRAHAICTELETLQDPDAHWGGSLGLAALAVLDGRHDEAVKRYAALVHELRGGRFNLDDLVDFADYTRADGYLNAVCLQVLYRRLAGLALPKEIERAYEEWLVETPSAADLGRFITGLGQPASSAAKPVKSVQRFKQKPKGRRRK